MIHDYHMGSDRANAAMAELERVIRQHDAAFLISSSKMSPHDQKQCMEICDEGVAGFIEAGKDCAPMQNLVVGLAFTLHALERWRKEGPLGRV